MSNLLHVLTAAWPGDEIPLNAAWLAALAIIGATLVHEDLATVATGMFVADGTVGVAVALCALYFGIVIGDLGLYGLGRLIAAGRISRRLGSAGHFARLKAWLDNRLIAGVFVVRFLPGLRFAAYTTYGFFAMPFKRFVLSVLLAVSIWTTALFYLAYAYGALTAEWLGMLRWPLIVVSALLPLMMVQRAVRARIPADPED